MGSTNAEVLAPFVSGSRSNATRPDLLEVPKAGRLGRPRSSSGQSRIDETHPIVCFVSLMLIVFSEFCQPGPPIESIKIGPRGPSLPCNQAVDIGTTISRLPCPQQEVMTTVLSVSGLARRL